MKVDLKQISGYSSLTVNDIYAFFCYSAPYGGNRTYTVTYTYTASNGELVIKTSGACLYTTQSVIVMVKPKSTYNLPLVYVSTTESYIDMSSVPNKASLKTMDMVIRLTDLLLPNTNGISGMQYMYYDASAARLYYRCQGAYLRSGNRTATVAIG